MMNHLKTYILFGIVLFSLALVAALYYGTFLLEAGLIYKLAWGKLMLFDLYMGFAIFSSLIIYVEKSWKNKALWIVSLLCLGNLVALVYMLSRYEDIFHSLKQESV